MPSNRKPKPQPLTEERVREIIRQELERAKKAEPSPDDTTRWPRGEIVAMYAAVFPRRGGSNG